MFQWSFIWDAGIQWDLLKHRYNYFWWAHYYHQIEHTWKLLWTSSMFNRRHTLKYKQSMQWMEIIRLPPIWLTSPVVTICTSVYHEIQNISIHLFTLAPIRMKYEQILIIFILPNEPIKNYIIYPPSHISYHMYFYKILNMHGISRIKLSDGNEC